MRGFFMFEKTIKLLKQALCLKFIWWMKILKKIDKWISEFFIFLIKIYQYILSPDKGIPSLWLKWRICTHEPHCSEYGIKVLRRYGILKWLFLTSDRVLHCTWGMNKIYDPEFYKVVFFSSAPIGVPFLEGLSKDKRFEIVGVVTQCDKPAGRWMDMCENIIKTATKDAGELKHCDIMTPNKLNPEKSDEGKQFSERLKNKEPDLLVVIAYGKIIPQAILDIPKIAPINIHGSLLPQYRGASPIQSIFLNNEKETWITIMKMDSGMDTGNMIEKLKFKIPFERTCKEVIEKMKEVWPKFLNDVLRKYSKQMLGEEIQNNDEATYCNKMEKGSWLIDISKDSLEEIYNKYRGFYLRPKIYFIRKEKRVIIEELKLDEDIFEENKNKSLIEWNDLNPAIIGIKVKPEGKKAMTWSGFVNGYLK